MTPDVCEWKAKSYDGVIAELEGVGRFIDPKPPTEEETQERERTFTEYIEGMQKLRAAAESGDESKLDATLRDVPDHVRTAWRREREMMEQVTSHQAAFTAPEPDADDDLGAAVIDFAKARARLRTALPLDDLASVLGRGLVEALAKADEEGPHGSGRVSMLLPKDVARAIGDRRERLDVQGRFELGDGSVVLVTSRLGEAVMEAMTLASLLEEAGFDREAIGPVAFFGESFASDLASAPTFEAARERLGERAEMLRLRTPDEWFADERAKSHAWLERTDED